MQSDAPLEFRTEFSNWKFKTARNTNAHSTAQTESNWVFQRIVGLLCSTIFSPQPSKCVSNLSMNRGGQHCDDLLSSGQAGPADRGEGEGRRRFFLSMSVTTVNRPVPDLWSAAGALLALQNQSPRLARVECDGAAPLSFAQERLWTLEQTEPGAPYYHVPLTWNIRGKLNIPALEKSLDFLVQRHDILRTSFPESAEGAFQQINQWHLTLSRMDTQHAAAEAVLREARQFVRAPFNLASGPLLRAVVYQRGADDFWLVLVVHQMI